MLNTGCKRGEASAKHLTAHSSRILRFVCSGTLCQNKIWYDFQNAIGIPVLFPMWTQILISIDDSVAVSKSICFNTVRFFYTPRMEINH